MPTNINGNTGIDKVQDGTVVSADIDTLDASKLTGSIAAARIASNTIDSAHIASGAVDDAHLATGITASKLTGTIADARFPSTLPAASAANLTAIPAANITGTLPAISAANLTAIPAANITGTLPAISGANLTNLPGGGKVLQVVNMNTSTGTGVSNATWTATSVELAITPSATSSKILLMWSGQMYIQNTAGDGGYAHKFQQAISGGATTSPVELHSNSAVNYSSHYTQQTFGQFSHYVTTHGLVSPSTTSAITYTLYIINYNANSVGVNGQGGKSNLTLMEIAG
jgi:hypothetical protein